MLRSLPSLIPSLVLAGEAMAQDLQAVVLKEHLVTEDHLVSLDDLFEGVEDTTALARAGTPGQTISLDPEFVQRLARQNGYLWSNAGELQRVSVRRASFEISAQELSALIAREFYSRTGRSHDITLSTGTSLHVPTTQTATPTLVSLQSDTGGGLFSAGVVPYPGAEPVVITGRAESVIDIPVLSRPIARGDIISGSDIEWIRLRSDRVRSDTILEASDLEGMAAKRSLRPGEALRDYDLAAPVMIERGETVALVFQSGPLLLTAQARALTDGAAGERIRFMNLQSSRTVEAVITGPGEARVGPDPAAF